MVPAPARATRRPARTVRSTLRSFWPPRRIRRPGDLQWMLLALAGLALLIVLAVVWPAALTAVADLVPTAETGLPRTALSVVNVAASLAVLAVLFLLVVDALRSRRLALTTAVLSCFVALLAALISAQVARTAGDPAVVTLLVGPRHPSAELPVTAAVAFLVGADLRRRRRLRRPALLALTTGVACALLLGSLTVPSATGAV